MSRPKRFEGSWYERNKLQAIEAARQWREQHPDRFRQAQDDYRERRRERQARIRAAQAEAQEGKCVVCQIGAPLYQDPGRSLLCHSCWTGVRSLEWLQQHVKGGKALRRYLKEWQNSAKYTPEFFV
jgi:hypothetical protein